MFLKRWNLFSYLYPSFSLHFISITQCKPRTIHYIHSMLHPIPFQKLVKVLFCACCTKFVSYYLSSSWVLLACINLYSALNDSFSHAKYRAIFSEKLNTYYVSGSLFSIKVHCSAILAGNLSFVEIVLPLDIVQYAYQMTKDIFSGQKTQFCMHLSNISKCQCKADGSNNFYFIFSGPHP